MQTIALDHAATGGGGSDGGSGGSDGGASDAPNDKPIRCMGGGALAAISSEQEVPSIMIALDRSPSMTARLGTTGTRFSVTRDAINEVLTTYGPFAGFGYVEFPGIPTDNDCMNTNGVGCCAGGLVPPVQAGNPTDGITFQLTQCANQSMQVSCLNSNATPTGQALKKIAAALNNHQSGWLYALLLTDGPPTCPLDPSSPDICDQTVNQITSMGGMSSSTAPISTFVIAVGDVPADDPTNLARGNGCLSSMATAGGHARGSMPPFYIMANTEALVHSELDNAVSSTICHVDITQSSFDADRLEVDFNGTAIPHDPSGVNGWNFDPNTTRNTTRIGIFGQACTNLITGLRSSSRHVVVKGCPDTSNPSPASP